MEKLAKTLKKFQSFRPGINEIFSGLYQLIMETYSADLVATFSA
jgi:hypothetical protein